MFITLQQTRFKLNPLNSCMFRSQMKYLIAMKLLTILLYLLGVRVVVN